MSSTCDHSVSASVIVSVTARGRHDLKIDGYSLTKSIPNKQRIKSCPFTVGGHRWRLDYYPNGDRQEFADYISLFLVLDETIAITAVKVQFHMALLVAGEAEPPPEPLTSSVHNFLANDSLGFPKFMEKKALEKSQYLKDDCFTVRCDIVVLNGFHADGTSGATLPASTPVVVPPPDLRRDLALLLQNEKGADVVFEVAGEMFPAHRCVLAARSPVFSAELFGKMKESATAAIVRIEDMKAKVFNYLLLFAYTELFPKIAKEEEYIIFQHLLVAADRYAMERLKLLCEHKLCRDHINVDTVATILALAEQHHCHGLKKACFDFLGSPANLSTVMASDSFNFLSINCPDIAKQMFAMLAP